MGTVETRSKNTSGCSSPSPENDKNELREALCALKSGAPENGDGFSGHGNKGFGDGGVVEVVKSRVFETKVSVQRDFVGREAEDGCQGLADSEMNGVSSLLKMRESGRSLKLSYAGGKDKKSGDDEDDDQYGKIVTIDVPIADTSENKDLEMEDLGEEVYDGFSVGDFVWGKIKSHPWWPGRIYDPSDASDFALKLRQKNRLLVAYFGDGTFAWCHPSQLKPFEENFEDMVMQSSSRAFVNAIQEAVTEVGRLLDLKMSSFVAKKAGSEFTLPLANNSGIKEGVLVPENGIERLSDVLIDPAELLFRVKQIAEMIGITSILELEILKARLSAFYKSRGGYKLPIYEEPQPIPGLEESLMDETVDVGRSEGAVEAPVQGPFEEDYSTLPVTPKSGESSHSHGISGNRPNHRIKQKSIAEIMGEDKDVNTKNKEGDATEKAMIRKKRKGNEDAMASKPVEKKKGLLLSTDRSVESAENDGSGGKENGDKGSLLQLKEKKEAFGNENASSGSKKETDQKGKAKEQNEKGSLARERKKSKYLSPPFTIPIREHRKRDVETESPKLSSKALLKPVTRASDQLLNSPASSKYNDEASQKKIPEELAMARDLPGSSNYQTPEDDENKTIDTAKIQVSSGEVLSAVRYAAISPQIPWNIKSLAKIVDFIFIYRSSLYHHGSYYKVYKKHQAGRKRKKPDSDPGILSKDQNQADHISPSNYSESKKRRRKNESTSGMPEEKQSNVAKTGTKGTDENASAAALFVSFGSGSSLPSKSDLIQLYSKFGALDESETTMFFSNHTARVFFLKASDAEKALSHSQNMSPFGSSEVSFRLEYLSAGSKFGEHGEKSNEASKLNYIKQKLQGLTSMLEASDGKSLDMNAKLEREMKGLLEDVNKMVESSSS
ncbi:PWWP domain-containing protein 3-like isoform X2 [Gastrolobium bilobum]|uniref:PWWP domain-containing protein 3-like isoform X2 n=1 Tax=Gastrolobium bilobum TaxID=150636 RepID=UPI002AB1A641|nr:PWWP domain-containing protein 3-like isoform X2 [Gastrolobium bilobum]